MEKIKKQKIKKRSLVGNDNFSKQTTLGVERETLEDFKQQKLKFQVFIKKEINDDEFLKKLLKSFKKYDYVFEIVKGIGDIE